MVKEHFRPSIKAMLLKMESEVLNFETYRLRIRFRMVEFLWRLSSTTHAFITFLMYD